MFSLTKHQTKIASFNPRAEKHGEENVTAGDIKVEATVHSSTLDLFDKKLRPMFFRKAEIGEVELSKFKFEPAEGGAVKVTFSASFHPDSALAGALCALIQDTVELTLTPPAAEQKKVA